MNRFILTTSDGKSFEIGCGRGIHTLSYQSGCLDMRLADVLDGLRGIEVRSVAREDSGICRIRFLAEMSLEEIHDSIITAIDNVR